MLVKVAIVNMFLQLCYINRYYMNTEEFIYYIADTL